MVTKEQIAPFEGFALNARSFLRVPIQDRALCGLIINVIGLGIPGDGAAELPVENVIENIVVEQDNRQKLYIEPTIQRIVNQFDNMNDETYSKSFMFIPFIRQGFPWSRWGTNNIRQIIVKAKIVAALPANTVFTGIEAYLGYLPNVNESRGDVFVQSIIQPPAPTRANDWNEFNNVPLPDIISLSRLIFCDSHITEVEVFLGSQMVYKMKRAAALFSMQINGFYRGDAASTNFPVMFDDTGMQGDFLQLLEGGVQAPVKLRYYWNGAANTLAAFKIFVEGVERGVKAVVPTAVA